MAVTRVLHVTCAIAAAIGAGVGHAGPGPTPSPPRLPDPNTWVPPAPTPASADKPSTAIYPAQRLPLTFSHAKHAARGTACIDCHAAALTSTAVTDRLLPDEAACARCHPIDRREPDRAVAGKPPAACRACHPGFAPGAPVARVSLPPAHLIFDHARHADTACTTCHAGVETADLATRDHLPRMATCLACHDGTRARAACTACHLAEPGGRVRTGLPDGPLIPATPTFGDAHDIGFARRHAAAARGPDAKCGSCHEQSDCVDCHAGVAKPLDFHPGDYVRSHGVQARRGVPDCTVCHRQQTFCVGCHERSGVGARATSDFTPDDPGHRFHPPGWVEGQRSSHAREARRNLDACASCHRDDFCIQCHTAEPGLGLETRRSPHPPNWRGSARCKAMDKRNRRMCLRCHVTPEQIGCDFTTRMPTPL